MTLPAFLWCLLVGASLLVNARFHGQPREKTNFWYAAAAVGIHGGLLYWGGFFS